MSAKDRLGNTLATRRKEAGLTQAALAEAAGVSRKTINTIENAVFVPSTVLALTLARIIGCTVEELFYLPDEE